MMKRMTTGISLVLALSLVAGCGTQALKGGAIGGGAGALLGGIIGKQYGNTAKGAIIGAAVGGTAGAAIGNYMDKQAAEMQKDVAGAQIERVGEGIKITFPSGILFQTNSSTLSADARASIQKFAAILNKYPDTNVLIEGHTDADGTDAFNQTLSEQRAASVRDFAATSGVASARMTTVGHGESQPVASNDTAEGKAQNRRVEIAIIANEKLKKAAEDGKLVQ